MLGEARANQPKISFEIKKDKKVNVYSCSGISLTNHMISMSLLSKDRKTCLLLECARFIEINSLLPLVKSS